MTQRFLNVCSVKECGKTCTCELTRLLKILLWILLNHVSEDPVAVNEEEKTGVILFPSLLIKRSHAVVLFTKKLRFSLLVGRLNRCRETSLDSQGGSGSSSSVSHKHPGLDQSLDGRPRPPQPSYRSVFDFYRGWFRLAKTPTNIHRLFQWNMDVINRLKRF